MQKTRPFWTAQHIADAVHLSRPQIYYHWRNYITWRRRHRLPPTFPVSGALTTGEARELMAYIEVRRQKHRRPITSTIT